MNEVFILGKVLNEINYNFIVNSKKIFAKAEFQIQCKKQVFNMCAYNNMADFCYREIKANDIIFVNGRITTKGIINIKKIEKSS